MDTTCRTAVPVGGWNICTISHRLATCELNACWVRLERTRADVSRSLDSRLSDDKG